MRKISVILVLLFTLAAHADEPPSWSEFEVKSANEKFVATVRATGGPDGSSPYTRDYLLEVFGSESPGKPMWSSEYRYDGYSGGIISDDGSTFVFVSFWYYQDTPVVTIYRGEGIKEIEGRNFNIHPSSLMKTVSHRIWLSDEAPDYRFVNINGSLALEVNTRDGRRHLIDVSTGRFLR